MNDRLHLLVLHLVPRSPLHTHLRVIYFPLMWEKIKSSFTEHGYWMIGLLLKSFRVSMDSFPSKSNGVKKKKTSLGPLLSSLLHLLPNDQGFLKTSLLNLITWIILWKWCPVLPGPPLQSHIFPRVGYLVDLLCLLITLANISPCRV